MTLAAIMAAFSLASVSAQVPAARKAPVKSRAQKYIELAARNEALDDASFGVLAMTEGGGWYLLRP